MAIGLFCWLRDWNANKVVSDVQMEAYGKTFLKRYKDLVQSKVQPAYQKYFSFLKGKPILINASISTSHGAAVEFIPFEEYKFQSHTVADGIGREVFPEKDPNTVRVEGDKTDHADRGYPRIGRTIRVKAEDISITRVSVNAILLLETGSLRTKEIVVDGINYPNTIIIKGSNRRNVWCRKAAKEEASSDFRRDFLVAYLDSEEFREFVATPQLTDIANEINEKQKVGGYGGKYGYLLMQEDLAKLTAAADAHGIKHEFSNNLYEFVKAQPRWRERNPTVFNVICGVVVGFLVILLILFFKWAWKWITVKLDG